MTLTEHAIKTIESLAVDSSLDAESKLRKIAVQIDFCSGQESNGLANNLTQVICKNFDEGLNKGRLIEKATSINSNTGYKMK
jgi:hypothetical protein